MSVNHWFFKGFYLFLILAWCSPLAAQNPEKNNSSGAEFFFSKYLESTSNKDSALFYADKALSAGVEFKDNFVIARALDYKGYAYLSSGDYLESLQYFQEALTIAGTFGYEDRMASIHLHLAEAHEETGELDSALYHLIHTINIRSERGDSSKLGNAHNNIANIYASLGRIEESVENYQQAAYFHLLSKSEKKYLESMGNWAGILNKAERYSEALEVADKALSMECATCGSRIEATLLQKKGIALFGLGQLEEARSILLTAVNLMESDDALKEHLSASYRVLAKIAHTNGRIDDYLRFMDLSIAVALDNGKLEQLKDSYLEFSNHFAQTRDFEKALEYRNMYDILHDSLLGPYTQGGVEKILLADLKVKSEKLIREQQAALQTKSRENQLMRIIGGLFFVLILGGSRYYYVIHGKNRTIEDQNKELQKYNISLKEDMVVRTNELEETSMVLDNFIYRTSHDIRGPIASLKGLSNVAQMEVKEPVAREYFRRIRETADNMEYVLDGLREVNRVKHADITPELLDIKALVIKSVNIRKRANAKREIGVTVQIPTDTVIYSDSEIMFTVVDKIIDNAFKFHLKNHEAPEVFIQASSSDKGLIIRVSDNGIGINEEKLEYIFGLFERASEQSTYGGIGLYVAKIGLNRLGGTITVDRDPDRNLTCFEMFFPVQRV